MLRTYLSRFALLSLAILIAASGVSAQRLVSFSKNAVLTADVANARVEKHLKDVGLPRFDSDVDLYKITYTSTDEDGKSVNLTGLAALPRSGAPKGLVVYMHGTQWNRKDSPSRFKAKDDSAPFYLELAAFATGGYAMVMPDYIGLGDNKRRHPYPLNLVNAQSGVDIIDAVRSLIDRMAYKLGDKLFVTGYSEGGGTAMGLTKLLEEKTDRKYHVTRSAPMSGPYDHTGAHAVSAGRGSGKDLIASFLLSLREIFKDQYGVNADEYFSKPMAVNTAFKDGEARRTYCCGWLWSQRYPVLPDRLRSCSPSVLLKLLKRSIQAILLFAKWHGITSLTGSREQKCFCRIFRPTISLHPKILIML